MTFREYLKHTNNFNNGLVKADLVENEDEVIVTLIVRSDAHRRFRERYEKEAVEKSDKDVSYGDPDTYATEQIETDKKEAMYFARDWAEKELELKKIKKKIRIVWSEEE